MSARHCQGCTSYTGVMTDCPGLPMGEFDTPDVVPVMRFRDRIRVLIGMPVLLGVTAEVVPPDEEYPAGIRLDGPDPAAVRPEYPDTTWPPGWDKELGL